MKGTVIFFSLLFLAGLYYILQPLETVRLKGIEGEVVTDKYQISVRSKGDVVRYGAEKVFTEPPYKISLRVMPKQEQVEYVELEDVLVFACGTTTKLLSYSEQLVHTIDYFDYKKPLAYYELNGNISCHGNAIMDISFNLRDTKMNLVDTGRERVLVNAYERTPTTLGYWWSMVKQ